jgi:hypothetical protein
VVKAKKKEKKVVKHEKTCSDNQHAFIPFSFDTFGFLAPEVVSPRSLNIVFHRIDFAIQKGLTAQLVASLPLIQVFQE